MSCTLVDRADSSPGPSREDDNHGLLPNEDPESCPIDRPEKLACDRCRQRKIKCDRVQPCSHCTKAGLQCTYNLGQKVKPKRQRILISSAYESRMEHISKQIDNLSEMMRQLSHVHPNNRSLASSAGLQPPLHVPRQSGEPRPSHGDNSASPRRRQQPLDEPEGIETTLFSHVMFATRFIQAVVADDPHSNVADEMTPVLDALRSVVNTQKQQNETQESSNPFSKALPPGLSFKGLPLPSMDRILACLRIAQERSPTEVYWPFEFGSLGDFTQYVIKACSPGPVTDMELIIVHYGLSLLFTECSSMAGDDIAKQEHEEQALVCRNSLETILSNLSFHISTNIESLHAMYMATIYCLQRGKPFAAWAFVSRASLISQALGLHNNHVMATEPAEDAQKKIRLFWALYILEKVVSLRLGRPSSIRDRDITVPRPLLNHKMTSLLHNRLPDSIGVASLYGRVYDDIYSPSALAQPAPVREARTRALASEFETRMVARLEFYKRPDQWTSHTVHPVLRKFIIHANRATDYSILAAIYRGIPAGKVSSFAPCPECVSAARATLKEAELCIAMLAHAAPWSTSLALWVNEILLLAPFMPFLILFCNIIQTSDSSDLARLQRLVEGLQSLAQCPRYSACSKQLRIFKALYEVAAKYVEANARRRSRGMTGGRSTDFSTMHPDDDTVWLGTDLSSPLLFTAPDDWLSDGAQFLEAAFPAGPTQNEGQPVRQMSGFQSSGDFLAMQSRTPDDFVAELDTSGAQLGSWFYQSHQMMGFLDDS